MFVCTGNTCRSVMSEGLARKILARKGVADSIKVISAGIAPVQGSPATPEAVAVMKEKGINLTHHKAQILSSELIREADLILTMTQDQKNQVLRVVPSACNRVFTLREYVIEDNENQPGTYSLVSELRTRLKEKEKAFYEKHGSKIDSLKKEYDALTKQLFVIEKQLMDLEREFAMETKEERQRLAILEEANRTGDIADPYGQGMEVYRNCAAELENAIDKVIDRFLRKIE